MTELSNSADRRATASERLDEAIKRGSEVLPSTITGSTADQPPLAMTPGNPTMTPDATAKPPATPTQDASGPEQP